MQNVVETKPAEAVRCFIDPGTKSVGVAIFRGKKLLDSTTLVAAHKNINFRIVSLQQQLHFYLRDFETPIDTVHFERMNRVVHHGLLWSVGAFSTPALEYATSIGEEISPTAWQKHCGWTKDTKAVITVMHKSAVKRAAKVDSEDELAAICMGIYFTETKETL